MKSNLRKLPRLFHKTSIGVVGDLMLDRYIWGDVTRISPEAPIPVVLTKNESLVPGGSGNTANNIVTLDGKVSLISTVGDDPSGEQLKQELESQNINTSDIITDATFPTIQKSRIIVKNEQLIRFDHENDQEISEVLESKIADLIRLRITDWDAVIISDYAKGLITKSLARVIIDAAKSRKIPVVIDTKSRDISHFEGCTVITPNLTESKNITGESNVEKAGKIIREILGSDVLITQGAKGVTLVSDYVQHFPTDEKETYDVAGAGDTFVAALTLALASGVPMKDAAVIANTAAGVVVEKIGTATVSIDELKHAIQ